MMILHVMDEVIRIPGRGVTLLVGDGDASTLSQGGAIRDAEGRLYRVASAKAHEGLYTLYLPEADADALERLFRNVRVDATAFTIVRDEDEAPCP